MTRPQFSWRAPAGASGSPPHRTAASPAPHCAVPRSRAASHAAAPKACAAPAAPTRHAAPRPVGCDAATPGLDGCRDRRATFVSPRRSPRVVCRSSVVVLRHAGACAGAACRCCALSLRVERTPRARPSAARRDTRQRRGAWRSGLALGDLGLFGSCARRSVVASFFDTSQQASQQPAVELASARESEQAPATTASERS